jgi:hypothetical protein
MPNLSTELPPHNNLTLLAIRRQPLRESRGLPAEGAKKYKL